MDESLEETADVKPRDAWETGMLFFLAAGVFAAAAAFTTYAQDPCFETIFVAAVIFGFGVWQRRRYLRGETA